MRKYHAKLLLFGEYTINEGSNALAIPYRELFGLWSFEHKESHKAVISRQNLYEFLVFLKRKNLEAEVPKIDTQKFEQDLDNGLWFDSNIPSGYGMGSSGALCAAIYDTYCLEKKREIIEIKKGLSQLECYFHGKSSGVDPLVSYFNSAILISKNKIEIINSFDIEMLKGEVNIFLIDSGKPRKTTELVDNFINKRINKDFVENFINPTLVLIEKLVYKLFNKKGDILSYVKEISLLQHQYMQEMILEEHQSIWKSGIDYDNYYLKLCGAGGGGFILGFTNNWNKTSEQLANLKIIKII
jgi:mevalonate kinase